MKMVGGKCDRCGGALRINNNMAICSECGAEYIFDDEAVKTEHTYRKIDEARIRETELKYRQKEIEANVYLEELAYKKEFEKQEKKKSIMGVILGLGIPIILIISIVLGVAIHKGVSNAQGKISAGYYADYIDEDYKAVKKQLKELGFTNIVTIDLDDSGLAFWNNGKVKSVSINGKDDFEDINYFYPDDKVIIKYH